MEIREQSFANLLTDYRHRTRTPESGAPLTTAQLAGEMSNYPVPKQHPRMHWYPWRTCRRKWSSSSGRIFKT
jgi:hypothetical protein